MSPARTADDFPDPDGPTTVRNREAGVAPAISSIIRPTSRTRP